MRICCPEAVHLILQAMGSLTKQVCDKAGDGWEEDQKGGEEASQEAPPSPIWWPKPEHCQRAAKEGSISQISRSKKSTELSDMR